MSESTYCRSPQLMQPEDTLLLVVDIQEKLLPAISDGDVVAWNAGRLVDAATLLNVPVCVTEQYPKGLGATVDSLRNRIGPTIEKVSFSCVEPQAFRDQLATAKRPKVLLCGIETHVCVQQTAFDLLSEGYQVYLACDAIGARHRLDHEVAIRRMEAQGVVSTTAEAAMFEWCRTAKHPSFKAVQELVKQTGG